MTIGSPIEQDETLYNAVNKNVIGLHGDGEKIIALKISNIGNGAKSNKATFVENDHLYVALQNSTKMLESGLSRSDFDAMFSNSVRLQNSVALIKKVNDEWIHSANVVAFGTDPAHRTKYIFKWVQDEPAEPPVPVPGASSTVASRAAKRKRGAPVQHARDSTEASNDEPTESRYSSSSQPTTYKGFTYDSKMEARFAVFLAELNIPYKAQPRPSEPYYDSSWTIDFQIYPNDPERMFFIEYKPDWPSYTELQKIEIMAQKYKQFEYNTPHGKSSRSVPVVLMYGEVAPPYKFGGSSKGLRGEMFRFERSVLVRESVTWTWRQDAASLEHHVSTLDQSWNETKLREAYDFAQSFQF